MRHTTRGMLLGLVGGAALVLSGCGEKTPVGPGVDPTAPFRLDQAGGYRYVTGGFHRGTAFASGKRDASSGNARIDYLRGERTPVVTLAEKAEPLSIQVSPNYPARVAFVDQPNDDGVGPLVVYDLGGDADTDPAEAKPETFEAKKLTVPQNARVPTEAIWFGETGSQILFIGSFSGEPGRGKVLITDGATTKELAGGTTSAAVRLTSSRKLAVVGTDIGAAPDFVGKLSVVDLSAGTIRELASGVRVLASNARAAFAVSRNGKYAAFALASGELRRVNLESGESVKIADAASVPALSPDGELVLFVSGGQIHARATDSEAVALGDATGILNTAPVISEDGQWVAYCSNVVLDEGPLGKSNFAKLDGSVGRTEVGTSTACDHMYYVGGQLAALVDLERFQRARYGGFGKIVMGAPGSAPAAVADGVTASSVTLIGGVNAESPRLAFIAKQQQGRNPPVGEATLAPGRPGDPAIALKELKCRQDGAQTTCEGGAVTRTLKSRPGVNRVLFISDPSSELEEFYVGNLWISKEIPPTGGGTDLMEPPKAPKGFTNQVAFATFAAPAADPRMVRVFAITGADGAVWSLSVP